MTNRQIETSREIRLWVTNVILPIGGLALLANEKNRNKVVNTVRNVKHKLFHKDQA